MKNYRFTNARFFSAGICCCVILAALSVGLQQSVGYAQDGSEATIKIREGFIASPARGAGVRGRPSIPKDSLESAWLNGELAMPDPSSDESPSAPGIGNWRRIKADEQGGFSDRGLAAGWLVTYVDVPSDGVWLLDARGHGNVRVNGIARVGDVYSNGMTEIPVSLKAGRNTLLFSGSRGRITAELKPANKKVFLSERDRTYPHLLRGVKGDFWGSLLLVNATTVKQTGYKLQVKGEGCETTHIDIPTLLPLSTRKVAFYVRPKTTDPVFADKSVTSVGIKLEIVSHDQPTGDLDIAIRVDTLETKWDLRDETQTHRRTFVSQIDGSVQYFGVVPPSTDSLTSDSKPALYLSLHGAGVEGEGQAASYAPKANAYIIAPTNRRAFGFDWEDWGRLDGLEVLEYASRLFQTDPQRTYLTGHSMGGHGTWHIGSLFPDRFAAIGPSAGWISFSTYAGANAPTAEDPVSKMLRRSVLTSDTLARVSNLTTQGVYILHGDADDNVPVGQARTMREELAKFHPDYVYKEQPGAGHWWGNACVDWPAMFQFFSDHKLPADDVVNDIKFVTPTISASANAHWATIDQQINQGTLSRIELHLDRNKHSLTGVTENVARLQFRVSSMRPVNSGAEESYDLAVELDGTKLDARIVPGQLELLLVQKDGGWQITTQRELSHKNPQRNGGFKDAFRNRFVLVYGTHGSDEENEWMLARARYDAETFWYRGNGSVDVVSDVDWKSVATQDRSVVVYGNATANAAWQQLLSSSPISVEHGQWRTPSETNQSPASVLMVRPRADSHVASVAAIGGTDLLSMRATNRLPVFSSGTGYADVLLLSPDFLVRGQDAIQLTGYFGNDWSYESGEWVRSEVKTSMIQSLKFHASFDGNADAVVANGDGRVYTTESLARKEWTPGIQRSDVSIAAGEGKFGDCLRFGKKSPQVICYRGETIPYRNVNWSGTVSFWMRLNPDKDLEPGFCDPLQITEKAWNDASLFVDFDKDLPRDFRLGVFSDLKFWNPENIVWEKLPIEKRPMVTVKKPGFTREAWKHVAFTFTGINATDSSPASSELYLDGQSMGTLTSPMKFTWDLEKSAIMLGIEYIGDLDELMIFDRALSKDEINELQSKPLRK